MSGLELDHLFVFVEPDFVDSADHAALGRFGLTLEFGRIHRGQGSANRLALFSEQSLEFLWLADRREAEANPLRLDRRADWRTHAGDPFGVCLRGRLDPELRQRWFWPYSLAGMPEPIWIARLSDDPRWPMIFVFDTELDTRPQAQGHPPSLLTHPGGHRGIARATLTSRLDLRAALGGVAELLPGSLQLQVGPEPRLEVVLRGRPQSPDQARIEVGPLTLTSLASLVG